MYTTNNINKYILLFITLMGCNYAFSQSTYLGNTYIGSGAEMSIINIQNNFQNGGSGVLPGIVSTQRTGTRGYLSFVGTATYTGATNSSYVDGYVRTYETTPFTFPVGNLGMYRPVAISTSSVTAPTDAAYYRTNPTNDGYTVTSVASGVTNVSTVEYWDVNGATPAQLTLTWDNSSGVTNLATTKIVGWNGSQWVEIPATINSGSTTTAGSITTTSTITPNTYSVYTLSGIGVSLPSGTLDCAKTQVIPAPVQGIKSQITLVVTMNVTSVGQFPVAVSGSGMTLANGITYVTTSQTGIQTFSIPLQYDGSTLGTLTFTVGTSTCVADLSSSTAKKKALVDVWTLDNCSIKLAAPTLK